MQGRLELPALCGCNIDHCSVLAVVWNFQALYIHALLLPGICETIFYNICAFLLHQCNSVTAYYTARFSVLVAVPLVCRLEGCGITSLLLHQHFCGGEMLETCVPCDVGAR